MNPGVVSTFFPIGFLLETGNKSSKPVKPVENCSHVTMDPPNDFKWEVIVKCPKYNPITLGQMWHSGTLKTGHK